MAAGEHIDVLNEDGTHNGSVRLYEDVHAEGLLHRTVHVWFMNPNGQLLLQKRAATKRTYPDMWDTSVAGHVSAGETSIEAAHKETAEEIGVDLPESAFEFLFSTRAPIMHLDGEYVDNEWQDVYLVRKDIPLSDMELPADEVAAMKWVDASVLKDMVARQSPDLVPHPTIYPQLFEHIG